MNSQRKKLALAIVCVISISIAMFLTLSKDQITYFYTVDEILQSPQTFQKKRIRVMGLVEKQSVSWNPQNTSLQFSISTDGKENLKIDFMGIKPDLFREGQGAVVEGFLQGSIFTADTLLVKHSEEYKVTSRLQQKTHSLEAIIQ